MKKQDIIKEALTHERNKIIDGLHKGGYSYSDIAFIFKLAHTTILRILRK
jgi:hypothetical protein